MREIPLTQGFVALVDDADYEELMQYRWSVVHTGRGIVYAKRDTPRGSGRRTTIKMHRHILNAERGQYVDHRNHNTLDNRRANIRLCTQSQNLGNQRKQDGRSSQFKGVCWYKRDGNWRAYIQCDGKQHHLGYHDDERDAARAYNAEARIKFGEFALLNDV